MNIKGESYVIKDRKINSLPTMKNEWEMKESIYKVGQFKAGVFAQFLIGCYNSTFSNYSRYNRHRKGLLEVVPSVRYEGV